MPEPEQQEPSGRDLARQALDEYKKRTWAVPNKAPGSPKPKPKRFVRTGDRRDPARLLDTLAVLSTDPRWEAGLASGSIIDQWATLCPQYTGLVQPVHYDEQKGRLDLRPGSHSYAAQLRLLGGQLAKQINDKMGRPVVRTIRVLPVGNIDTPEPTAATGDRPDTEVPVRTRADGCPGYQDVIAVVLEHRPERTPVDPYVEEAMRRQEAVLRASRPADTNAPEGTARPTADSVDASLARARAYARQQRASGTPRRAFDTA